LLLSLASKPKVITRLLPTPLTKHQHLRIKHQHLLTKHPHPLTHQHQLITPPQLLLTKLQLLLTKQFINLVPLVPLVLLALLAMVPSVPLVLLVLLDLRLMVNQAKLEPLVMRALSDQLVLLVKALVAGQALSALSALLDPKVPLPTLNQGTLALKVPQATKALKVPLAKLAMTLTVNKALKVPQVPLVLTGTTVPQALEVNLVPLVPLVDPFPAHSEPLLFLSKRQTLQSRAVM